MRSFLKDTVSDVRPPCYLGAYAWLESFHFSIPDATGRLLWRSAANGKCAAGHFHVALSRVMVLVNSAYDLARLAQARTTRHVCTLGAQATSFDKSALGLPCGSHVS